MMYQNCIGLSGNGSVGSLTGPGIVGTPGVHDLQTHTFVPEPGPLLLAALVWALCRYLPRLDARTRAWLWWLVATQMVVGLVWHAPVALPLLPAARRLVADWDQLLGSAHDFAVFARGRIDVAAPNAQSSALWCAAASQ